MVTKSAEQEEEQEQAEQQFTNFKDLLQSSRSKKNER